MKTQTLFSEQLSERLSELLGRQISTQILGVFLSKLGSFSRARGTRTFSKKHQGKPKWLGHWKIAKKRSTKSTQIVFALFRLFSLVFDRCRLFFARFRTFWGCLFLSAFGRPFLHSFAPVACCHSAAAIYQKPGDHLSFRKNALGVKRSGVFSERREGPKGSPQKEYP